MREVCRIGLRTAVFMAFFLGIALALRAADTTIVTLGDSITKGVRSGVTASQTFATLLQGDLSRLEGGVRVVNVGIGGERTDQALKRLDEVLAVKPQIVTVMYGTNDSYVDAGRTTSRISQEAYAQNLEQIVVQLLGRGIVPVVMTEPRWAEIARLNGVGEHPNVRLARYMESCREVAQRWRVPLVDNFAHWTQAREAGTDLFEWTTDACHPNPAGHRVIADTMLPVLRRTLGPRLRTRTKLEQGGGVRIVCFGDSVTGVYYHTGSRRAYTDMFGLGLKRLFPDSDIEMINAGISGHTTVNALERIERDVLAHSPDLVTVMFGLNDMTRVPLDQYRANLNQIVDRCEAAKAEVMLVTPNNVITTARRPTEKLVAYCDVVRDVARERGLALSDCYRELEARRRIDAFDWRLLMSDEIHPNMDGHQEIAEQLVRTLTGRQVSLDDIPPSASLARTRDRIANGQALHVLAMPPYDRVVKETIAEIVPELQLTVSSWPVANMSLTDIEQDAKERVRASKPDLVILAIPGPLAAADDESFAHAYAWTLNWSVNFARPTWDCLVVHPSVTDPRSVSEQQTRLVHRLVPAQDGTLIMRDDRETEPGLEIVEHWLRTQLSELESRKPSD